MARGVKDRWIDRMGELAGEIILFEKIEYNHVKRRFSRSYAPTPLYQSAGRLNSGRKRDRYVRICAIYCFCPSLFFLPPRTTEWKPRQRPAPDLRLAMDTLQAMLIRMFGKQDMGRRRRRLGLEAASSNPGG